MGRAYSGPVRRQNVSWQFGSENYLFIYLIDVSVFTFYTQKKEVALFCSQQLSKQIFYTLVSVFIVNCSEKKL